MRLVEPNRWRRGLLVFFEMRTNLVDTQVTLPRRGMAKARNTGYATQPPLQRFLTSCYEEFK